MKMGYFIQIFIQICLTLSHRVESIQDSSIVISTSFNAADILVYSGDATSLAQLPTLPVPTKISLPDHTFIRKLETNCVNSSFYFLSSTCAYEMTKISPAATVTQMRCGISNSAATSLAFDWVRGHLYWLDGAFGWIAFQPINAKDSQTYRVVIQTNFKHIRALAIDPVKRFLFWFDNSPSGARIERASLTGQNRTVILSSGFRYVMDIVADVTSQKLFWVDYTRYTIESCDYDGMNRRVLYRVLYALFFALDVGLNHVCATIPAYRQWFCIHKNTGELKYMRTEPSAIPYGIGILNRALQPPSKDFCTNTSCEHFCVNGDDQPVCMCKEGYSLNTDGKSCKAKHGLYGKGVIVSYNNRICMLEYSAIGQGSADLFDCVHIGLQGVSHLSVDSLGYVIFYVDSVTKEIKAYDVNSKSVKTLHSSTGQITGLTYDWLQQTLYWCESVTGIIGRISVKMGVMEIFINATKPEDITVDPHNRMVFWIDGSTNINSCFMENNSVAQIPVGDGAKRGLYFDVTTNRLYWIQSGVIKSMKTDGSEIIKHAAATQNSRLLIYKSYAVWISGDHELKSTSLRYYSVHTILLPGNGTVTGISAFDEYLQPQEKDACDDNNGGCEHICIPSGDGRRCSCSFGYDLGVDNTSCVTEPFLDNFMLATDLTHGVIYQVELLNGDLKALNLPLIQRPVTAIYDSYRKYVYWTESITGQIIRSRLNGEQASIIYTSEYRTYPQIISLAPTNGYIYMAVSDVYYTISSKGYLGVVNPETTQVKTLITGLNAVLGLVLYPSKGIMFFINWGGDISNIYRASMDGTDKSVVFTSQLYAMISGLTIDYETNLIFWSMSGSIMSADLSENLLKPTFITQAGSTTIRFLLSSGTHLYYCSDKHQTIAKLNLTTKQPVSWMPVVPEIGLLMSLDVHPKYKLQVHEMCSKKTGSCSTFCLPKEASRTCVCQEGVAMTDDGKTCSDVKKCPTSQVSFGKLEVNCQRYPGESCSFTCNNGYLSNVNPPIAICQQNNTWNYDLSSVCTVIKCSDKIPYGRLGDKTCSRKPGTTCHYICNSGYVVNSKYSSNITCLDTGDWNHPVDQLCKEIRLCTNEIQNGGLENCVIETGASCQYYCDDNYTKKDGINTIVCSSDGQWSPNVDRLCIKHISESPTLSLTVYIAAGASGVVLIIISIVVVVFCNRRRQKKNDPAMNNIYYTARSGDLTEGLIFPTTLSEYDRIDNRIYTTEDDYSMIPASIFNKEMSTGVIPEHHTTSSEKMPRISSDGTYLTPRSQDATCNNANFTD